MDDINKKCPSEIDENIDADCFVTEGQFPCLGRCLSFDCSTASKNICSYCEVWTSLPNGANLEVATIVECRKFGYGKRIRKD
ncbi:MAG: hypothetical protein Q8865_05305 [Bacillota bacterium]|nr:hypothetical protein [Bacillota bacterium]